MGLAVLMVSMGRLPLLKQSLGTLFDSGFTGRVVVVEQGATEAGTREWLLTQPVTTLMLPINYGKGYAWNVGLKILGEPSLRTGYESPPTHALFCDDDVVFSPGWGKAMLEVYSRFFPLGLRALSGFRHVSSDRCPKIGLGGLEVLRQTYCPGCCLLVAWEHALKHFGANDTQKPIGFVEGPPQKVASAFGCWSGSMVETVIDHAGAEHRTYRPTPGGFEIRADVVNMPGP